MKDWIDNTMMFWDNLLTLDLPGKYANVRLNPIHWGRECFVHEPSGVLWHFEEVFKKAE